MTHTERLTSRARQIMRMLQLGQTGDGDDEISVLLYVIANGSVNWYGIEVTQERVDAIVDNLHKALQKTLDSFEGE